MKKLFWIIIRKLKLGNQVKNLKVVNDAYNYMKFVFFRILGLFIKNDERLIIFSSYSGTKYDDSPKAIFEYLINNSYYSDYKIIWAFKNPKEFMLPEGIKKVKVNSFYFYRKALSARYFISNAQIGEGFYFKGKDTIYLNSWHGSAIKKIGIDRDPSFKNWILQKRHIVDYFCAQSDFDVQTLSRAFQINEKNVVLTGLPRNDELIHRNRNLMEIKRKIGVNSDKKIIIYAPTYRNYEQENGIDYIAKYKVDFQKWKEILGDEYIVLFRAHYYIAKSYVKDIDGVFIIDVSSYPYINDLLMVSDILISDYSSLFFDYSIMGKPMYCYAYDLEEYSSKVGIYFDIDNELPNGVIKDEEDLLNRIKNIDWEVQKALTIKFRERYVQEYGNATENVVNFLFSI